MQFLSLGILSKNAPLENNPGRDKFFNSIKKLEPGYFAFVMATGIVSIAAHYLTYNLLAKILLIFNSLIFIVLLLIFLIRIFVWWKFVVEDFYNSNKNMGFLSFPAACCVLGSQLVLISKEPILGFILFLMGFISWIFTIYTLFAICIEESHKPSLTGVNGSWLLIIVSTQSLSVISGLLASYFSSYSVEILFFSLIFFLCGCMFYIIIITMIFYRLLFLKIKADKLQANYWISMGADAISVLAGTILVENAAHTTFLTDFIPFLTGFSSFYWAIGTWWIPLIIVLGIWRHWVKKVPLVYTFQYWSLVFPLGMYSVCTAKLSGMLGLDFLMPISFIFGIISIVAWLIVLLGMSVFLKKSFEIQ